MTETPDLRSTRAAYDAVAADYADRSRDEMADKPLDRAVFAAFAEYVLAAGGGPVADLGCGPGHGTAHLRGLGLDVFGVDLSPGMVAVARRSYPGLRFEEGSMTALDLPDGGLGGVVALYSIIHIPPDRLPGVFAEFNRVLAPGGEVLVAFQVRAESVHVAEWFGHDISLDFQRWSPEHVVDLLADAGLVTHARLLRQPDAAEKVQRAYLLARKAGTSRTG